MNPETPRQPERVTEAWLRRWPLPLPSPDGDKEERGRTLVIAGSREMPGAAVLAATAALRAGAGKLVVATPASAARDVALALPEARVIALPESPAGGLDPRGAEALEPTLRGIDAVLIGPGMLDEETSCRFVDAAIERCGEKAALILDALAMGVVARRLRFERPVLLTPHAGEMAHLTGASKDAVERDPLPTARAAAARWNAVVALKGSRTHVAAPGGAAWLHDSGDAGLATSGSGDVLAGIVAGLAARGAELAQACVWGVALHGAAGRALAARLGPLGYLARELPAEIPRLMHAFGTGCDQPSPTSAPADFLQPPPDRMGTVETSSTTESNMADDTRNRGGQDRTRINVEQEHELRYWTEKFGVSADVLRRAVADVGPQVDKVEPYLKREHSAKA